MELCAIFLPIALIVVGSYYFFTRGYNFFKDHGIPHQKPVPLLGNAWRPLFRQASFGEWVQEIYNIDPEAKYVGLYDMMAPVIVLRDPELIKSVTVKNFQHFPDHITFVEDSADFLFSKSLFSLRGDRWKEVRATLSPAFTSSKLKGMFKLMLECATYYGNYLASLPEDNTILDVQDVFSRYTSDVIATCAFGIKVESMKDRENKFFVYGREATVLDTAATFKFFFLRSFPSVAKFFGVKFVRDEVSCYFRDLVRNTIRKRDQNGIVRPDMIQLMMETRGRMEFGEEMSIEEMTAQAFSFLFGGFESTSSTLCFAAHEIAVNPDVQEKLINEIDELLEQHNGEATYELIKDMKYLDAVVNEALRMYPVGLISDRKCGEDFELPAALPGAKPITIKSGADVWISMHGLHYDPKYFDEPTRFNPDRFYVDPKKYFNSGVFIPFGIGPRMCIGYRFALLQMKVLLFHLLARCELKPCNKTTIPMKLSKKLISMRPDNGFWLKIEPRKSVHSSIVK